MDTLYLNYCEQDVPNKADYLLKAARRLKLPVKKYSRKVISRAECPIDYILNVQPYRDTFARGAKWAGVWEIDCLVNRHRLTKYWDQADTVFLANNVEWVWREKKIDFDKIKILYQACDPSLYKLKKIDQGVDVMMIGNISDLFYYRDFGFDDGPIRVEADIYSERHRLLKLLNSRFKVQVVYSSASNGNRLPLKTYLRESARGKVQFIQSMVVGGEGEIGQRFFEMLPIGPVLTNWCRDLEEIDLVENVDYLCYRTDTELYDKMRSLVTNDKYRLAIAENGCKAAFERHTYDHRLTEVLDYLGANYGFKY